MLSGIDVSGFQEPPFTYFANYDFVIIKATEGSGPLNSQFSAQVTATQNAGKLMGFYHYAHPEFNSAATEAQAFINMVQPYIGKAILALDWEGDAVGYPVSWIKSWLDYVHDATGVRPFFYSYSSYVNSTPGLSVISKDYPLWLAQYTSGQPSWSVWPKWTMWQYQGSPLDLDYFDGARQDWLDWCGEINAEWITGNRTLRQAEMENNAQLLWKFFRAKGWTLESVCGMLGNIQRESSINPGVWQNFSPWGDASEKGYGLVQWTPYTRITNWLTQHGYPLDSGEGECTKIQEELDHPEIEGVWYPANGYNMTFREYTQSHASPDQLAMAFLYCYERPPAGMPTEQTKQNALNWYSFLRGAPVFIPRFTSDGIANNPKWYSLNPFYQAGYGLPNCTCYCWGRWYEITGTAPNLPLGNGNQWFETAQNMGISTGQTPQLGAVICTWYADGGHVAIVEQINADGSIIVSNSGWPSTFFWTETLYPPNYLASWMPSNAYVQGFIYLPTQPTPPDPSFPPDNDPDESKLLYYLKVL